MINILIIGHVSMIEVYRYYYERMNNYILMIVLYDR